MGPSSRRTAGRLSVQRAGTEYWSNGLMYRESSLGPTDSDSERLEASEIDTGLGLGVTLSCSKGFFTMTKASPSGGYGSEQRDRFTGADGAFQYSTTPVLQYSVSGPTRSPSVTAQE